MQTLIKKSFELTIKLNYRQFKFYSFIIFVNVTRFHKLKK